jgi:hypothetical protein
MAMHANFPDWYRSAGLSPQSELLETRWAAIDELTSEPNPALVVELARLFILPSPRETSGLAEFREAFKKQDTVFPSRNNLQELRVLAGATLRALIEQEDDLAPLAALGIVCGSFGPRASALPEREHLDEAERFLVRHASETRKSAEPAPIAIASILKTKPKSLPDFSNPAPVREPLVALLGEIYSGLNALADQAQKAISALSHTAAVREEEVGILWWLHSRFSSTVQKPFGEVGYLSGAILFPVELAKLTSFVPGPEYLSAVLVRALQDAGAPSSVEPVTLANATNSLGRELREQVAGLIAGDVPGDLIPVLFAISKSLETDGPDDWFPVFRRACEIPLDWPFPVSNLSTQLYRELMLVRAFGEAQ